MIITTDGIVLREQQTGEKDRLVTLLTREIGVIRAFVNGARNPKNKNAAATGLLCFSDFSIDKTQKGVFVVREASPKEVFFELRSDLVQLSLAQYFAELAYELAPREESGDEFLRLLLNAVAFLMQKKKPPAQIKAVVELRMLTLSGYMPSLVACDSCGAFLTAEMKFCPLSGRLFCADCTPSEPSVAVSDSVVEAMRHICFSEANKVFSFRLSAPSMTMLGDVSERYLKAVTNTRFRTLEFYKAMTK